MSTPETLNIGGGLNSLPSNVRGQICTAIEQIIDLSCRNSVTISDYVKGLLIVQIGVVPFSLRLSFFITSMSVCLAYDLSSFILYVLIYLAEAYWLLQHRSVDIHVGQIAKTHYPQTAGLQPGNATNIFQLKSSQVKQQCERLYN